MLDFSRVIAKPQVSFELKRAVPLLFYRSVNFKGGFGCPVVIHWIGIVAQLNSTDFCVFLVRKENVAQTRINQGCRWRFVSTLILKNSTNFRQNQVKPTRKCHLSLRRRVRVDHFLNARASQLSTYSDDTSSTPRSILTAIEMSSSVVNAFHVLASPYCESLSCEQVSSLRRRGLVSRNGQQDF